MTNIPSDMRSGIRLLVSLAMVLSLAPFMASCQRKPSEPPATTQTPKASPNPSATSPNAKAPDASCYRTIVNSTDCPWTFQVEDSDDSRGNVWFEDQAAPCVLINCTNPNGPCTVPPNCNITIHYTSTRNVSKGRWFATDKNGTTKGGWYFESGLPYDCPSIDHTGNTGAITLNEPANGDMVAGQCTW